MRRRDTSRHWTECACADCEGNETGIFALSEVLVRYRTDEVTDEINREIIALCESRGREEGACHV